MLRAFCDARTLSLSRYFQHPSLKGTNEPNDFFRGTNVGWLRTVVFNNVYGWHYSDIPSIGIWRSVRLKRERLVAIQHPFVSTKDAWKGVVDLCLSLESLAGQWNGRLLGTVQPENFRGESFCFQKEVQSDSQTKVLHLRFSVPKPRLWWPNDLGKAESLSNETGVHRRR